MTLHLPYMIIIVHYPQGWPKLESLTGSVYVSAVTLEAFGQLLQPGVMSRGIEVSESETQTPAFGKEF